MGGRCQPGESGGGRRWVGIVDGNSAGRSVGDVALIGPGRAGRALAYAWRAAGIPITVVVGRRLEAARSLAEAVGARALLWDQLLAGGDQVPGPDVWVLAVPDRLVGEVAAGLARRWERAGAGTAGPAGRRPRHVLHLSGALGLGPLAPLARLGVVPEVFHPLVSLTGRPADAERLRGVRITIIHPPGVQPAGPSLAAALGALPVVWPDPSEQQLALYHAAATMAANAVTALLWAAEELLGRAGYPSSHIRPSVAALAAGAVNQSAALGPLLALTGPIARGDAVTVRKHLEALGAAEEGPPPGEAPGSGQEQSIPGVLDTYRWAARLVLAAARAARAGERDATGVQVPAGPAGARPPDRPAKPAGAGHAGTSPGAGSSDGADRWEAIGQLLDADPAVWRRPFPS